VPTQSAGQLAHVSLASQTPFVQVLVSMRQEASQRGVPLHPPHVAPPRFAPSHCSPGSRTPLPQLMLIVICADAASWPTWVIVSPADGIVVALEPAAPPPELEMGAIPVPRIGIFLNLFDVHVARAPVGGKVMTRRYTKGRFVNASLDKASLDNERLAIRMAPPEAPEIAFVLIAGLVARRIVCGVYEGQTLAAGERIGIIRFGSRVDVYCPPPYVPLVALGQRMIAGETVLADRGAAGPPGGGFAH
jgi:phosphatidylserine decarboxylase